MPTGAKKGFNPARKVGSGPDNKSLSSYTIASGYATSLGLGDPVKLHTDGTLIKATNGADAIGVFGGVKYINSLGEPKWSKAWIASTVATEIEALVLDDPFATFSVLGDGPIAGVVVGDIYACNLEAANTSTGNSQATIAVTASTTGNVALPLTTLVGAVSGMADGDTFTIYTNKPGNSAVTITIATATTGQEFLDALNAVDGIVATRNGSNYLVLTADNGYDIVLATGTGAPLTDLGLSAGTKTAVVAANAGLVKVVKVTDVDNYVMEAVLVNHSLRDDV